MERREKRAAQKAAVEGFKQLLEEAAKVFYLFSLPPFVVLVTCRFPNALYCVDEFVL